VEETGQLWLAPTVIDMALWRSSTAALTSHTVAESSIFRSWLVIISRKPAMSKVTSSHRVCGSSGDLLCLDLSLEMRLVLFTGEFGGSSNRFDPVSGLRAVESAVVPSKKVVLTRAVAV